LAIGPTCCEAAPPSVRLVADGQIDATVNGVSRLGGSPDLPGLADGNGTPLSFIVQLGMRQMASHDVEVILPRAGMLSCLYAAASQRAWGHYVNAQKQSRRPADVRFCRCEDVACRTFMR
jgi:Domain of unknown function (DUF1963)